MAMESNPAIAKAEELLQRLGSLEEVRRHYEAREKAIHDEVTRLAGARKDGKIEVAEKMLAKGLPEDLIIETTGLSPAEVAELKKESQRESNPSA